MRQVICMREVGGGFFCSFAHTGSEQRERSGGGLPCQCSQEGDSYSQEPPHTAASPHLQAQPHKVAELGRELVRRDERHILTHDLERGGWREET